MSLTGKTLSGSYKDILQVDNSNNGITTSAKVIKDGEGTASCISIADDSILVQPQNDDTTTTLRVRETGGGDVLDLDTTNE